MIAILDIITRYILIWVDRVIYGFIPSVYNLLIEIAETTIFSQKILETFSSRIYGLLGIFMLFKVSFSILNYIVNPDDFTDKNKGFSKIISNILITLVLLVITPWIFSEAFTVQRIILRDNVIGKLILGTSSNSSTSIYNPGQTMAYETFRAFYHPDDELYDACADYNSGEVDTAGDCVKDWIDHGLNGDSEQEFTNTLTIAAQTKSVSVYLNSDLAAAKAGDDYVMSYIPIISTIAGGFIAIILISFCFDIAVRSIKLGFYQMISPIPIISRLDPKKGKETFSKWVKACLGTFADLFIRLAAIYFAIFVITQIISAGITNAVTGSTAGIGFLTKAFIIMGALLFAKELPKLLEDLLGIKLSGKFEWNPLKKAASVPLVGKPLENSARFVGRTGKTLFRAGAGAIGGFAAGTAAGKWAKTQSGKFSDWRSGLANDFSAAHPKLAGTMASISNDAEKTFYSATGGMFGSKAADGLDAQIKALQQYAAFKDQLKKQADYDGTDLTGSSRMRKYMSDSKLRAAAAGGAKGLKQYYEDLQKSGASYNKISSARQAWEDAQKDVIDGYTNNSSINSIKAHAARLVGENRDIFGDKYSSNPTESYDNINNGYIAAQNEIVDIQESAKYQTAQAKKAAMPPKKDK